MKLLAFSGQRRLPFFDLRERGFNGKNQAKRQVTYVRKLAGSESELPNCGRYVRTFLIGEVINDAEYLYRVVAASLFTVEDVSGRGDDRAQRGDDDLVLRADPGGGTGENEVVGIYDPYTTLTIKGNSHTYRGYPPQRCTDLVVAGMFEIGESHNRKETHPKYRKGHILKYLMSTFSSFSARLRSFRGRPRPRGAGAFDLGFVTGVGWRTS